jgi:hypothetical protein
VFLGAINFGSFENLLAVALLNAASDLVVVLKVRLALLGNGLEAGLVDIVADGIVPHHCFQVDHEARNQGTVAKYTEVHFFLRVDCHHAQAPSIAHAFPRGKIGFDVEFAPAEDVHSFFAVDLREDISGRVDLPYKLCRYGLLEPFGPVAKEEDIGFDELQLVVKGDFCMRKKVPYRTSSLSWLMKVSSSSTLKWSLTFWLLITEDITFCSS